MASAGPEGLDPRQLEAREEFQRMREQLRRTLERNVDAAPWRERSKERVAFYKPDVMSRRLKRPLATAAKRRWVRPAALAAGAFVVGVVATLAAVAVLPKRAVAPAVPAAAGVASAPDILFAAASAHAAPPVALAPEAAPPPVEAQSAGEPAPVVTAVVAPAAATEAPAEVPAEVIAAPAATDAPPVVQAASAEAAPAPAPPAAETAPDASNPVVVRVNRIRESQTLLAALGYVPGRADGSAGPQTVAAATLFATERGLQDANLDAAMLAALRVARAGGMPVRPSGGGEETVLERVTRIREIQALLVGQGAELGRPDGDAGPQTLTAAALFAAKAGLADANLDAALLAYLRELAPLEPAQEPAEVPAQSAAASAAELGG